MKECNSVKQSPIAGLAAYGGGAGSAIFGRKGVDGYQIDRSLRFNSADSAYLNRTPSTASNRKTWTWSGWVKRSKIDSNQELFAADTASGGATNDLTINSLFLLNTGALDFSGYYTTYRRTYALLRDPSAWYHIVLAVDTTQSTASDRIKLYINGSLLTSSDLQVNANPSQDFTLAFNQATNHTIGARSRQGTISNYQDGYLADVHFIDGQAHAATDFGAFDADTGVWNPKRFSGSFGTNGFHLKFDDYSSAAALGTDSSSNTNTFTTNNFSVSSVDAIYAVFSGSSNQYLRKSGSGVLPGSNGSFTIECHFYPHTTNVIGLFDGGAGQTNIIRNYSNNVIENQGGGSVNFAGDYTQNAWNHLAVTYDGYTDTMTVYLNGTSSGTATFNSFTAGSNFDIGTINGGGDGRFDGFIRNFRVTHSVVYSSAFTAPSHTANLTAITNTNLLALTTSSEGLTGDASTNNYTLSNNGTVTSVTLSGPAGVDSLIDTPTNYTADSGNNGGNYATWNPLQKYAAITLSNGNLDFTDSNSVNGGDQGVHATIAPLSGKFYWEMTLSTLASENYIGISRSNKLTQVLWTGGGVDGYYYYNNGNKIGGGNGNGGVAYGASFGTGDVIGVAVDWDNGKVTFYKNGSSQGDAFTGKDLTGYVPAFYFNTNQSSAGVVNFGQRPFAYTPPTGYVSLCTQNLADPTIADGSTAFDAKLWTGNGSTQSITGLEFSPDFVWIKSRDFAGDHALFDAVRGATKRLRSNQTNAENTDANTLTAFNSDGFSIGSSSAVNNNTKTFVGWAWDGGTSTASNTDGSITSNVRANASAGFSVVGWTGTSANGTIGHGLNAAPEFVIVKKRGGAGNWYCYHSGLTNATKYIWLNSTVAEGTQTAAWNSTAPTSTVVHLGAEGEMNANGVDSIAYCFAPVEGYSAFGSYTGNGNADGPFVFTGFRPRWVLFKNASGSFAWHLYDTARDTFNLCDARLRPDNTAAEDADNEIDILSNGFKIRTSGNGSNQSGSTFIYAAFAENSFKTARAR